MFDQSQDDAAPTATQYQDWRDRIMEALAAKPDGVPESISKELGVSTQAVLELTPRHEKVLVSAEAFDEICADVASWGPILFVVHTRDIVLECTGSLPTGTYGHGYYNLSGSSPIHGHIKVDNCRSIYLVDRLFHGRRSCSVQFFNNWGEPMFKIFVGRGDKRELIGNQVARFEALWSRLQSPADDVTGVPV